MQQRAVTRDSLNTEQRRKVNDIARKQAHEERDQRLRENRSLRKLPPSQRAERREQIRRDREQRAQQHRQVLKNAGVQQQPQNKNARSNSIRNNAAPMTALQARQGRFAAPFAAQQQSAHNRHHFDRTAARHAWRRHHRAAFVAWFGPVFWPYAYSDIFDYTFWPGGYEDGYWSYVYDDFFDGVFWGEAGPPAEYVYAEPSERAASRPTYSAVQNLCKDPGKGITAWPFAEIESKVRLNDDQKPLLDDVRKAAQQAADTFKSSCPSEQAFPLTPPGRLQSMMARLQATLAAVDTVRPALERFYNSLSDEQKERFNEIGPGHRTNNAEASAALPAEAKACREPKPGLTNLPIEQIQNAIGPTATQQANLDRLGEATVKAVGILQAACPDEAPLTPPGRLQAMEKRLKAMLDAATAVKPSLDSFYASLDNEQKARFNRLGRNLAQSKS